MSVYILLGIMINLAGLTYGLFATMNSADGYGRRKEGIVNVGCVVVPIVITILAYVFEDEENMASNVENGLLNVARHSFQCSMRFPRMVVEWLLLWVHFVWSGGAIIYFAAGAYLKVNSIQVKLGLTGSIAAGGETRRKLSRQKRRLFNIALMCATCLLLNLGVTIWTGTVLEGWSQSTDIWLNCKLHETLFQKDWDSYDFVSGQKVCSGNGASVWEDITACTSDCSYLVYEGNPHLACGRPENLDVSVYGSILPPGAVWCDCACDDMIGVERPSVVIMTLAHVVQSAVVTIVGLSMGLRKDYINHWRVYFKMKTAEMRHLTGVSVVPVEPRKEKDWSYHSEERSGSQT